MTFQLAIYDSTQYANNSFWCFREPSIPVEHLERFYRLLVLNQDIASLDTISTTSPRIGVGVLNQDIGVSYRIFPGQESSRLSSVVIALFFDLNTWRDTDLTSVWNQIQEIEQYITHQQRGNGILSCPLREPSRLSFEVELPVLPLADRPHPLTPFPLQDTKVPDFRSDRFISDAPKETLLATLQTYARESRELVCTAHFKNSNHAEIHALWLPTPKPESSVPDIRPPQAELPSSGPEQIFQPNLREKHVFITLTVTIILGAVFLLAILVKHFIKPSVPRPGPIVVIHPIPPLVKRTNTPPLNFISNVPTIVTHSPTNNVQPIQSRSSTNVSSAVEHQE